MKKHYYITTTLPYVNSSPHIGFASEAIRADVLARFNRLLGKEVFFNTGTDEHGQKIAQKATEKGVDPQEFCDEQVKKFKEMKNLLNLSWDNFVRTTDENHMKAAQAFWMKCKESGDIYKAKYKIKYCVGCELEKTDSELNEEGRCPLHPDRDLEIIEEENYFFKFSNYQEKLLELYEKNPEFVKPAKRLKEIKHFAEKGLQDFSVSRLKKKMPWGVPVPDDEDHVMYVWFDALVNYISVLGWPEDGETFQKWWPGAQIAGKDNLRQQSAMWQAMLISAGLPNSEKIYINGFITSGGQKMSKSLGNVVAPEEMLDKFGADGTRYLLLSMANFGEDFDLTEEKMISKYNAELANGIGNIFSRVVNLSKKIDLEDSEIQKRIKSGPENKQKNLWGEYNDYLEQGRTEQVLLDIREKISVYDKDIEKTRPWELVKTDYDKFEETMLALMESLWLIAERLEPFMPETSEKMKKMIKTRQPEPLFPRIEKM
ncbi:MAG: methionine--tRNA ligase [Candidatus Moranbacteria bacterium]|nr:methionine--tRNA ligase [Candidatus Moranbacteria bacterium]